MANWFQTQFGADVPPTVKQGSKGDAVKQWQSIIGVKADGDFGPGTAAATKAWQAAHNLTADGVVGPVSWGAALNGASPAPNATPPAPSPIAQVIANVQGAAGAVVTHATIRQGSKGPDVTQLQQALGISPADGVFGPATAAKVEAFQKAAGLSPDGVVGPQTWMALHTAHASVPVPSVTPAGTTVMITPSPATVAKNIPVQIVDPTGQLPPAVPHATGYVSPPAVYGVISGGTPPAPAPQQITPVNGAGQPVPYNPTPWYKSLWVKIFGGVAVAGGAYAYHTRNK